MPRAARLVQSLFGDRLAQGFTKEYLVSGQLARDVFDTLRDAEKAKVIQEALALLGVDTSVEVLRDLVGWLPAVPLFEMIWDMGSAIILAKSSGGVVFSSLPEIQTTTTSTSTSTTTTSTTVAPSSRLTLAIDGLGPVLFRTGMDQAMAVNGHGNPRGGGHGNCALAAMRTAR